MKLPDDEYKVIEGLLQRFVELEKEKTRIFHEKDGLHSRIGDLEERTDEVQEEMDEIEKKLSLGSPAGPGVAIWSYMFQLPDETVIVEHNPNIHVNARVKRPEVLSRG